MLIHELSEGKLNVGQHQYYIGICLEIVEQFNDVGMIKPMQESSFLVGCFYLFRAGKGLVYYFEGQFGSVFILHSFVDCGKAARADYFMDCEALITIIFRTQSAGS